MPKVAIIADSIACLPPEMVAQYGLRIMPINIHYDGHIYRDGVDLDAATAYRLLEKAPELYASSPASAGEYLEAYREMSANGGGILCITLSSRLSTLYDMARVGLEEAGQQLPGVNIVVMDSKTAAVGEGLIVTAAARAAAEGEDLAGVVRVAESVRDRVNVIGILETVRYAYRTGRIPRLTARVGSMLNIKPVFTITGGVVRFAGLARNKEQAIKRALKIMAREVRDGPVHVAVAHAAALEEGERLRDRIAARFDCAELWLTDFSPVMGYATGAGVLAIGYYAGNGAGDDQPAG